MSRIDEALKRAAGRAEGSGAGLADFGPVAVAEFTFTEPDPEPLLEPVPRRMPEPATVQVERLRDDVPFESLWNSGDCAVPDRADEADPRPVAEAASPAASPEPAAVAPVPPASAHAQAEPAGATGAGPAPAILPGALFRGFDPKVKEKLVVGEQAGASSASAVAIEQYRRLAATLHHAQVEREIRVVMITSALAGEGKTLTATNLALTLSESYRRNVLLIDADLRRPGLHQIFQLPNASGLHEGLAENADRPLSLLEITPHLMLLPAGRPDPDPMGVLTSSKMRRVVEEAAARFDWVIMDAPPVGLITDASLLAKMADVTLVVVQAGETDYRIVRRAVDAVGRDRVLGVVVNRMALPESPYGYSTTRSYAAYRTPADSQIGDGSR